MPRGSIDKVPILRDVHPSQEDESERDIEQQMVVYAKQLSDNNAVVVGDVGAHEAGRGRKPELESGHDHRYLLMSGPLGMCNDPFCTSCPYSNVGNKRDLPRNKSIRSQEREKSWKFWKYEGVLNPHSKSIQTWNKVFVVSCLLGIFLDPLFFFPLSVDENNKCIVLDYGFASTLTAFRSVIDFLYICHIILQFRLAYKDEDSGEIVDDPARCKTRYLRGWFGFDVLAALPLPQIMVMLVIPNLKTKATGAAGNFRDLFRVTLLLQNIPRLIKFVVLVFGRSPTGIVFETAWANFVLNLFLYVLAAHVVGSSWYLFGVQRVMTCLQEVCLEEKSTLGCRDTFLDCGFGAPKAPYRDARGQWIKSTNASGSCLIQTSPYEFGIYQPMGMQIAQRHSVVIKYIYSLYWGFLQISTLGGNLVPSLYPWEVLFTMGIGALGLLMFASLIGSMQNFLQSLGRRKQEMQMRRRDVENFMERRRLPLKIRKKVRQAERFNWVSTQGVEDEEILRQLPEDLQMTIKCHVCENLLKEVRLFKHMDPEVRAAIFERLREKVYVTGSTLLRKGSPTKRMYFIARGSLSCVGHNGFMTNIGAGKFCGEELLLWHLEQGSKNSAANSRSNSFWTIRQNTMASQDVECLENVNAFVLEVDDVAYIANHFGRLLRTPRIQGILRNDSTAYRLWAAVRIQTAWRFRAKIRKRRAAREAAFRRQELQRQSNRFR